MAEKRVAVIGAGPSGLAAARQAIAHNVTPVVFEQRDVIGGRWSYARDPKYITHLPSTKTKYSKILSSFSDFPASEEYSEFLTQPEVEKYLQSYVDNFNLQQYIQLNTTVTGIKRHENYSENGVWLVSYERDGSDKVEEFEYVLIATGRTHRAYRPNLYRKEGEFQGRISHSAQYKSSSDFKNQKVVLVGFGDTAIELAKDLAGVAKDVIICVRHGEWLNFRTNSATNTAWDPNYNSRLSAAVRKFVPTQILNKIYEKSSKSQLDLKNYGILDCKFGYWNTIPVFGDGLRECLERGDVRLEKDFLSFGTDYIEYEGKKVEENVDQVIFCTGYEFDFRLVENGTLIRVRNNDSQLYLHMFHAELPKGNLAVIGLANSFGPRFPISELQAKVFFGLHCGKWRPPSEPVMRERAEWKRCQISVNYLKTRRHTQIEGYVDFMKELASKIDVDLKTSMFITDPLLALKCCILPMSSAQFRLGSNNSKEVREQLMRLTSENSGVLWAILAVLVLVLAYFMLL
ncbi:unnamed protein product [Bursaphelenchus okinawaensis]|uniref:Flavin-containing monooxygenase n=1 Tax=Bursaphelenchus okinawaensis TaxID=465554 RepID=A0A811KCC1_9BILA|nr:unnamed protein product [Bursaphelenchus okinawaensis]CAG9097998.1 unnamed protein product [Bursaphelenchus okinawaensis]